MPDHRSDLIRKAANDPKFRAELLKDPDPVVEKFTGVKLPAGVKVVILEDAPSVVHLVLPRETNQRELSDETLTSVVGGVGAVTRRFACDSSNQVNCVPF